MVIPFDIPIFILMYRKDLLDKHGIKVPTTYPEFTNAVKAITQAESADGVFGTGLQAKFGHYSLECDWSQAVWGHGGSVFGKNKRFSGNDEQGIAGLNWYRELLNYAPPNSRSEEHTSELQSRFDLVCRLLLEKKNDVVFCTLQCHRHFVFAI